MHDIHRYQNGGITPITANSGFNISNMQQIFGGSLASKLGGAGGGNASQILGGMFGTGSTPTSPMGIAGGVADTIGSFIPKKEQHSFVETADAVFDSVSNTLMAIPGWGTVAGGIMKIGGLVADGLTAMGVGTDQMTKLDRALDSKFLKLLPSSLINAAFAKRTRDFKMDQETYEDQGSAYGGTYDEIQDAEGKAGKKYGLFSSKQRRKANAEIDEAERKENIIQDINEQAQANLNAQRYWGNTFRSQMITNGGYQALAVGRKGMKLDIDRARKIVKQSQKLQIGGAISDPFEVYLQSLPQAQRDSTNFRVRDYWEYNGRPKNFDEARKKGMFEWKEDFDESGKSLGWSWHAFTVAKNPNADEYDFMKSSSHPTVQKEIDWYNSDAGSEFRKEYELQKVQPYYKYVKRKAPYKDVPIHKEGGSIIELVSLPTEILLVDPNEVPEFQEGGSINVIPEGALHARKHNMDMEGITKKGIPVIDNEGEQQAEIERSEIILRLELTQKLEELEKEYKKEEDDKKKREIALEAGKLLIDELLNNTIDNTGELL